MPVPPFPRAHPQGEWVVPRSPWATVPMRARLTRACLALAALLLPASAARAADAGASLTCVEAIMLLVASQACLAAPIALCAWLGSVPLQLSVTEGALRVRTVLSWAPRTVPLRQIGWCQVVSEFRTPTLSLPVGNTRLTGDGDWLYGIGAVLAVTPWGPYWPGLLVGLTDGRRLFFSVPYADEVAEALRRLHVDVRAPGDPPPANPRARRRL